MTHKSGSARIYLIVAIIASVYLFSCHSIDRGVIIEKRYIHSYTTCRYDVVLKMVVTEFIPEQFVFFVRGKVDNENVIEPFYVTRKEYETCNVNDSIYFK